jgi:hypothetical protein
MSFVQGPKRGYETDLPAGDPLFFQISDEVGSAFKYDHFIGFRRQNRRQRRFYNKNCTFANLFAVKVC